MENLNKTEKTEKLLGKDIKVEKEGKIENESHIESNNPTNTMKSLSPSTQYSINVNSKIQHSIVNPLLLSNKICTSKYNFINAVPKILCEQFSKVGNIYFLFLAILQMVPVISQSGGSPVMLLPLLFVVLVNGIKDFCEDYKRKQSDNRENKTKCTLIDPNTQGEKLVNWEDLKPGDILKIYKDEYFPADLLMMYSINKNGVAYVETKNLDGETNLKYKECVKSTYRLLKHFETEEERVEIAKKTFGRITCDYPNASMYDFEGVYYFENRASVVSFDKSFNFGSQRKEISNHTFDRMHSYDNIENSNLNENVNQNRVSSVSKNLNQVNITAMLDRRLSAIEDEGEKLNSNENSTIILEFNNLLLRGSSLRNTDYIYGIVIYSGHFSKIMLNSLNARSKQSKVFKIMNSQLKFIILLQMVICFTFALFYSIDPNPYEDIFHFKFKRSMVPRFCVNFIYAFLSWLLTICNIVPISLLVTIEMIKFCQAVFISWDSKMYDKENRRTAIVQSSALNEELGQVHDIFSDKTGTLTKNVMQFKYMVIGDFLYGSDKHINLEELKEDKITNVDFNDPSLFDHWNNTQHVNSENIQ